MSHPINSLGARIKSLSNAQPIALLLLRCGAGIVFLYHGYPKLVHARAWGPAFVHMGFPSYFAYLAGFLESIGGIFLVLGLATRASALLLAVEMMVAFFRVDLPWSAPWQVDRYELSLLLAVGSLALASFGGGRISMDNLITVMHSKRNVRAETKWPNDIS